MERRRIAGVGGDELTQLADEVGGDWTEHAGGLYRDGHARVVG